MILGRPLHCRLIGLAIGLIAGSLFAQQPADELTPVDKEQIESALKLTTAEAAKYTIHIQGAGQSPVKLRQEPLLRWSNPSVGEIHGNVFLWTLEERPAAIGSLFKWFTPHTHMSHEFHSLAESPLSAKYGDSDVWQAKEAGVSFAPLPGAPAPAASAVQRLLQMKRFARDFTATKLERDGNKQELRLLTQPIYRYAAPSQKVQDGGLFVLVQGTDPEVFLLLEARGETDTARWMFAAARMNGVGFDLRYQDKPAWSVEIMPWREIGGHAEVYTSFMFKMP